MFNFKMNKAIKEYEKLIDRVHAEKNYNEILKRIKQLRYEQIKQFEYEADLSNEIEQQTKRLNEQSIFNRCKRCNILYLKSEKHNC